MKNHSILGLADKFEKQAGAGERVWIVLYVIPNSDHMVQGVFSSQELADAYLKSQSVRPDVTNRLLVKSYVVDANPVPTAPVAPATPEPVASR